MSFFSLDWLRPLRVTGVASRAAGPAMTTPQARAADTNSLFSTRTLKARAGSAPLSSIFERACRDALKAAARAWSDINDNAHADRRAPPRGNPGGRRQGKPDRRI